MNKFKFSNYKLPHMTPLESNHTKQRFTYDPADKKAFQALTQKQKDSLHAQAMKFDKPYFSPKFGVNVDPEDGVLSNRPVYSDGTKLTYDIEDKPVEDLVKQAYSKRYDDYMSMVGKKKHPMLPEQTKEQAKREFFNESYSTKFNTRTGQIEDVVSSSGDGAASEEDLAKIPSYLRNPLR